MSTVHPNIADPNAFAGFEVRIEYCDRRRDALPCVTGELMRPEWLIWLHPLEGYFRVRIYTFGMSVTDLARVQNEARGLPNGHFAAIRHWRECSTPGSLRYTQTRGTLISFDFDEAELMFAVDRTEIGATTASDIVQPGERLITT